MTGRDGLAATHVEPVTSENWHWRRYHVRKQRNWFPILVQGPQQGQPPREGGGKRMGKGQQGQVDLAPPDGQVGAAGAQVKSENCGRASQVREGGAGVAEGKGGAGRGPQAPCPGGKGHLAGSGRGPPAGGGGGGAAEGG